MKFNYLMFNNSMALVYSSGIPIVKQGAVSVGRFSLLSSSRTEIETVVQVLMLWLLKWLD